MRENEGILGEKGKKGEKRAKKGQKRAKKGKKGNVRVMLE